MPCRSAHLGSKNMGDGREKRKGQSGREGGAERGQSAGKAAAKRGKSVNKVWANCGRSVGKAMAHCGQSVGRAAAPQRSPRVARGQCVSEFWFNVMLGRYAAPFRLTRKRKHAPGREKPVGQSGREAGAKRGQCASEF